MRRACAGRAVAAGAYSASDVSGTMLASHSPSDFATNAVGRNVASHVHRRARHTERRGPRPARPGDALSWRPAFFPIMARMPTSSGMEPPGTPAAPTAVITDITMTMIIPPMDRLTPNTWQRKMTVDPSKIDGCRSCTSSNRAAARTRRCSPARRARPRGVLSAVGSVALLELVEKPVISAERIQAEVHHRADADDKAQDERKADHHVQDQRNWSNDQDVAGQGCSSASRTGRSRRSMSPLTHTARTPSRISTIAMTTLAEGPHTSIIGLVRFRGLSIVSAAPNMRPKKIMPSMSSSAADFTGFRVTMLQ